MTKVYVFNTQMEAEAAVYLVNGRGASKAGPEKTKSICKFFEHDGKYFIKYNPILEKNLGKPSEINYEIGFEANFKRIIQESKNKKQL